jgi:predicted component of type VI protein secretion system
LKYKPPLSPAEFGYWDQILKTHFPNYPHIKKQIFSDDDIDPQFFDGLEQSEITNGALVSIPLEKVRETLYVARFEDDRLLHEAKFYLLVGGKLAEHRLIETVPLIARVAWLEVMETIINSALPGVELIHKTLLRPERKSQKPSAVPHPVRFNFQYFLLNAQSPYWDGIKRAKNIAVRVPDEIPDLQLKMYADTTDFLKFDDSAQIPWRTKFLRKFDF